MSVMAELRMDQFLGAKFSPHLTIYNLVAYPFKKKSKKVQIVPGKKRKKKMQ